MASSGVHVAALGFADELFFFHSSVLEPDGDLALREVGGGRDASPLIFGDELAGGVLLFQLLQLDFGVRDAFLAPSTVAADLGLQWHDVCEEKSREIMRSCALKWRRDTSKSDSINLSNDESHLRAYFWRLPGFRRRVLQCHPS